MLTRTSLERDSKSCDRSAEEYALNWIRRYLLPPRNVIPVPDSHETKQLPEFGIGQDVLALYPGTTCFYKATVVLPPNKASRKNGNSSRMFHMLTKQPRTRTSVQLEITRYSLKTTTTK